MISFEAFQENVASVRAEIARACAIAGRQPSEVQLLAVTKTQPREAVEFAARCGLAGIGENRVQEAATKKTGQPAHCCWELIGHLQSNKARLAVELFDRVQSVDSVKIASHLGRAAAEANRRLPVLLQIKAGNDPAKFGAEPADAEKLIEAVLAQPALRVQGLMTIAPLGASPAERTEHARRTFENLSEIRNRLASSFAVPLPELSMGMSGDLAEAVAAGSTMIRVGTALFGTRAATG